MTLAIVTFRPDHAAAWKALNTHWLEAGGYPQEAKDHLVLGDPQGAILDRGGAIFIAERHGEAIGCCSLLPMEDGGYEVGKMAVAREAQGLGLGNALLEACEDYARARMRRACIWKPIRPRPTPSRCIGASASSICRRSRRPT